jgi:hypothetical protein
MDRLSKKWEKKLAKYGLALSQLESQDVQMRAQPLGTGIQTYQFDSELDKPWALRILNTVAFEETKRMHLISVRDYERPIPDWALNDESLQRLIQAMYPNLHRNMKQFRRASVTISIIYRYFRVMDSPTEIASDLGISPEALKFRLARIRKLAPKLLALPN